MALTNTEYYQQVESLQNQMRAIKKRATPNQYGQYDAWAKEKYDALAAQLNQLEVPYAETQATTKAKAEAAALQSQVEAMKKEKEEAATSIDPLAVQKRLSTALEAQAKGETPSLAEAQMKATAEKTLAQQLAAAGAARGGNQAALQRQLAKSQMASSASQAQEAAQLRLQEQQQAQQLLAQNLASAAGYQIAQKEGEEERKLSREQLAQDYELTKAGYLSQQYMQEKQRQASLTGGILNAVGSAIGSVFSDKRVKKDIKSGDKKIEAFLTALEKQKLADGGIANFAPIMKQKYAYADGGTVPKLRSSISNIQDNEKYKMPELEKPDLKIEETREPSFLKNDTIDFSKSASENIQPASHNINIGKILGSVTSKMFNADIPAGSTPTLHKSNISRSRKYEDGGIVSEDEKTKQFLDALKAYEYKYKNPNTPYSSEGNQMSVMAQDLEKTELGKNMVEELPNGTKLVNYGKGFGTILAAQANLNKRLEELEKKKSKK